VVVATLLLGLVVLTAGAELLVRGASRLATAVGVSPLVVGLTVVAFGTSAPELVVSLQSTLTDRPDVAIGNVIGSNILNVLLILGLSAMIVPLRVSLQVIRIDAPVMVSVSIAVLLLAIDGRLGRLDGLVLAAGLVGYSSWTVVRGRREQAGIVLRQAAELGVEATRPTGFGIALNLLLLAGGLGLLVLGASWFNESAVAIARRLGLSELVIGLTIVAAGTSLPEVATSLVAAVRGERDIAVGNVVGSNLFNLLGVLGISAAVGGEGLTVSPEALRFDLPVMIAVAVACLPIFFTGHVIARWEGVLFLVYYVAYTTYVVAAATLPELAPTLATAMLGFVIPLTAITLAVSVVQSVRGKDEADESVRVDRSSGGG
jgi:cation:H+ antiporter